MPTFEYVGNNADGQPVRGTVFGASLDAALSSLTQSGLNIEKIAAAQSVGDPLKEGRETGPDITSQRSYYETSVKGRLVGLVPLQHLLFFFQQFATMEDAGVPLIQSLETLQRQARSPKLAQIVGELRQHAEAGRRLSDGMQRYPEVFSPIMMSMVRAGEEGGFFADALKQIASYIEREVELRNLYRRITFYPKLQFFLAIFIVLAANLIITSMGKKGIIDSPLTHIVTWIVLAPFIIGAFLFFRVGLANPRIKYGWDEFILGIPYLGNTLRQYAMAKFGRAFGALHKAGVPLQRCLQLSADSCGNEYLRARMYPAYKELETGRGITDTLRSTGAFNDLVMDMVSTGETTGNLDMMLTKVSEYYEDDSATRGTQFAQVVGTVLFLCVAVYIAYVVITFYTQQYAPGAMGVGGPEATANPDGE